VSSYLAGPFCSTQLAEFGAEVWKIELPKDGDRAAPLRHHHARRRLAALAVECRNKKSITLDMSTPEGAR
jgi:succinyl-CoA:(S)-malate CoA-transferase subunit B